MSISQFFILTSRGDKIIFRDFRKDVIKEAHELFFYNISNNYENIIFNIEGINFVTCIKNNLYFTFVTKNNDSPSFLLEVLLRLLKVIKDYCGLLNEEVIRKNFILVYEIIDEMIDFGYPQLDSTEDVKKFIYTEPLEIKSSNITSIFKSKTTTSSNSTLKPITNVDKNEIFVDFTEKISVLFNSSGQILNYSIDGFIVMKVYLKTTSEISLTFNDDINFQSISPNRVSIEDYNFHSCVDTKYLEKERLIIINPPEGEFTLMNYRVRSDFVAPFKLFPYVTSDDYKIELRIKVRSIFPEKYCANNVIIKCYIPKSAHKVKIEMDKNSKDQSVDYIENENICIWKIKKFIGGNDCMVTIHINCGNSIICKKELGPISMNFDIPMYNLSKIQVKYLRVSNKNDTLRWIRYMTTTNSYVSRI